MVRNSVVEDHGVDRSSGPDCPRESRAHRGRYRWHDFPTCTAHGLGMSSLTFAYARISTTGQRHDSQRSVLDTAGYDRLYEDTCSGTVDPMERPGFTRLVDAARPGDELLIFRLDRLGRSAASVLRTVELLDERGITLRSLSDGISTSGPSGKLVLTIMAGVASLERSVIAERSREGIAAARARGQHLGRPSSLTPDQQALARQLRASGESYNAIARALGTSKTTVIRVTRGD